MLFVLFFKVNLFLANSKNPVLFGIDFEELNKSAFSFILVIQLLENSIDLYFIYSSLVS